MKPLIFDFKTARAEHNFPIAYRYDENEFLNVIDIDGKTKVFIDIDTADVSITTQTKVIGEADDFNGALQEMSTITKVGGERQDQYDLLLELKTKTFTVTERDDK